MTSELLECVEINPEKEPAYVVIWLHGLGADGHDFEAIVPELRLPESLPVRYLFPHAPTRPVTINMGMVMRAWYDILEMDVSRKVDVDTIVESSGLLRDLIQRELDAGIPSERILLAGFSQGGAIVLHTALRYEKPLAGLLALSTYLPTLESLAAERSDANRHIPILMAHGKHDPMIPIINAENTREALTRLGYTIQWHTYPMEHQVCTEEIEAIRNWMLEIMQPAR
jgi:phospholipase/carboxylesterase